MYVLRSRTFFITHDETLGFFLARVGFGFGFSRTALDVRLGVKADRLGWLCADPLRLELRRGDLASERDRERDRVDAMMC